MVSIVTGLQAKQLSNMVQFPAHAKDFVLPGELRPILDPPSFLFNGFLWLFSKG